MAQAVFIYADGLRKAREVKDPPPWILSLSVPLHVIPTISFEGDMGSAQYAETRFKLTGKNNGSYIYREIV